MVTKINEILILNQFEILNASIEDAFNVVVPMCLPHFLTALILRGKDRARHM